MNLLIILMPDYLLIGNKMNKPEYYKNLLKHLAVFIGL